MGPDFSGDSGSEEAGLGGVPVDEHWRLTGPALRAVIEDAMGAAAAIVAPGIGRVTWKAPKDRVETDWKAVAARYAAFVSLLDPAIDLEGEVAAFTTTKPSTRRFTPKREREEDPNG